MFSVLAAMVLTTVPSSAMSGAVAEFNVVGVLFPPTPAAELALGFHHEFTRGGGIEVRARGGVRLHIPGFRPDGYFTGTVHYVTPRIRVDDFALTFGVGAGAALFSGCSGDDVCMPLGAGPIIEVTHRLLFPSKARTQFFFSANLSAAVLPASVVPLAFTAGVGVGCLFDLRAASSWGEKPD